MEKRGRGPEIDFVPEETDWRPDGSPELWENEGEEDLERTLVLEPISGNAKEPDRYEERYPDEERYIDGEGYLDAERYPDGAVYPDEEAYSAEEVRRPYLKYGRDPYDHPEQAAEVWPAEPDVWFEEGRAGRRAKAGGPAGKAERAGTEPGRKRGSRGRSWRRRPILLRLVSLTLMAVLLAGLFRGLWTGKEAFGSMASILEERSYGGMCYLFLAAGTMAYGAFSLLWMVSRRKVFWDGRLKRMDTGRGMCPFLLFALLAFAGSRLALRLPGDSWFFDGLSVYFLAAASVQHLIYVCSGLGAVSCVLRKLAR